MILRRVFSDESAKVWEDLFESVEKKDKIGLTEEEGLRVQYLQVVATETTKTIKAFCLLLKIRPHVSRPHPTRIPRKEGVLY